MKKHIAGFSVLVILLILPLAGAAETNKTIRPPGEIHFSASNLFATAKGQFHSWRITEAKIDDQNPASSIIVAEIDIASIDTGIKRRDNHLRSDDFFDIEKFPIATVELRDFEMTGPSHVTASVKLRIRDFERTFPMTFEIIDLETRRISAITTINRVDYGVGGPRRAWNPASVKEEVEIRVEVIVPKAGPYRDPTPGA